MVVARAADDGPLGRQEGSDTLPLRIGQASPRDLWARQRWHDEGRGSLALTLAPRDVAALGHRLVRPPEARPAQQEGVRVRVRRTDVQQTAHLRDGEGDQRRIRSPFCAARPWPSRAWALKMTR